MTKTAVMLIVLIDLAAFAIVKIERRKGNEKEPRKKRKKEARKIKQESPGTRKSKAERKETKRRSR